MLETRYLLWLEIFIANGTIAMWLHLEVLAEAAPLGKTVEIKQHQLSCGKSAAKQNL